MSNKEDICHIVQRKRAIISLSYMKICLIRQRKRLRKHLIFVSSHLPFQSQQ